MSSSRHTKCVSLWELLGKYGDVCATAIQVGEIFWKLLWQAVDGAPVAVAVQVCESFWERMWQGADVMAPTAVQV